MGHGKKPANDRVPLVPCWLGSSDELEGGGHMLWSELGPCVQLGKTGGFLGKDRSAELLFVCSDMWQAYLKVIAKGVKRGHSTFYKK